MRKRIFQIPRSGMLTALLFGLTTFPPSDAWPAEKPETGLAVTFTASEGIKASDMVVSPNLSLCVPSGQPPTPFLPGGRFSADWTGFVSSEIRDSYTFRAELNGELRL